MKQYEVTSAIWLGDFMALPGEKLSLKEGFKLYSPESNNWININYVPNHIKEI